MNLMVIFVFRKMRRIKQELSEQECISILKSQLRGVMAVKGDMDYPYTVPMNYVYNNKRIIFHSALEGHKIDSIKKDEKVSFCVIDEGKQALNEWYYIFRSVIIFGKIHFITNEKERYDNLMLLAKKYFPDDEYTKKEMDMAFKKAAVMELEIEHMTGKIVTEK